MVCDSTAAGSEQLRVDLAERDKRIEAILQEAESLSKKQAAQELTIRTLRQTTKKAEDDAAEAVTKRVRQHVLCCPAFGFSRFRFSLPWGSTVANHTVVCVPNYLSNQRCVGLSLQRVVIVWCWQCAFLGGTATGLASRA